MAPKPWTTQPQLKFLKGYIPKFVTAQATKKTVKLWPKLFAAWFTEFPEEDVVLPGRDPLQPLTDAQKKEIDVNMKGRQKVSVLYHMLAFKMCWSALAK
jgi:hypothetical protein